MASRFTGGGKPPRRGDTAVPAVRAALQQIAQSGIESTTESYDPSPAFGNAVERELLARYRVRRVRETLPGGGTRLWEILVLNADVVTYGPAEGEPGREAFIEQAIAHALREPIRELVPDDAFAEQIRTERRERRRQVEEMLHMIAAVASLRRACTEFNLGDRCTRTYRFEKPGFSSFELLIVETLPDAGSGPGELRVRLLDNRTLETRIAQLAKSARRRVIIDRRAELAIRALPAEVQDELEGWIALVRDPEATPEQLGLPTNPLPSLRGVKNLGSAHTPAIAGVTQGGVQQAVAVWTEKGFEVRIGTSTDSLEFWELVVGGLEQRRFKPGQPGAGHFALELRTRRRRVWAMATILVLQIAAGLQEASNSGHVLGLAHRLALTVLDIGLAGMCIPLGQFLGAKAAKHLLMGSREAAKGRPPRRVGTRPLVAIGTACYAGLWLAGLAPRGPLGLPCVMGGWLAFGFGNPFVDIPLGVITDRLNQGSRQGQFAALHFFVFTLASIAGSAVTIAAVDHHVSLAPHMAVVWAVAVVITAALLGGPNLRYQPTEDLLPRADRRKLLVLYVMSAMSLGPLGAVYLFGPWLAHLVGASATAAPYATFAFTSAAGLVQGIAFLVRRSRPRASVVLGAMASLAGAAAIAVAAFDPSIPRFVRVDVVLVAFALVGAGLQLAPAVLPEAVGKVARQVGASPTKAAADNVTGTYIGLGMGQAVTGIVGGLFAAGVPLAAVVLFGGVGFTLALGARRVPRRFGSDSRTAR